VIDASKVSGMDSSGARTLADVSREMINVGVTPVLASADHHGIVALLRAHDVPLKAMKWPPDLPPAMLPSAQPGCPVFAAGSVQEAVELEVPTGISNNNNNGAGNDDAYDQDDRCVFLFKSREEGLRFCEDALLEVAVRFGLCTPPGARTSLEDLLASHLERMPLTAPTNAPAMAATLRRYLIQRTIRRGEMLWNVGDPADELFLLERGVIQVDQFAQIREEEEEEDEGGQGRDEEKGVSTRESVAGPKSDGTLWQTSPETAASLLDEWDAMARRRTQHDRVRSFELGPGCVAGSTDFYLARPHRTRAVCASVACRVLRVSRHAMKKMASEAPAALNVLQMAVMRLNTSDLAAAADVAAGEI